MFMAQVVRDGLKETSAATSCEGVQQSSAGHGPLVCEERKKLICVTVDDSRAASDSLTVANGVGGANPNVRIGITQKADQDLLGKWVMPGQDLNECVVHQVQERELLLRAFERGEEGSNPRFTDRSIPRTSTSTTC